MDITTDHDKGQGFKELDMTRQDRTVIIRDPGRIETDCCLWCGTDYDVGQFDHYPYCSTECGIAAEQDSAQIEVVPHGLTNGVYCQKGRVIL
jgi:hypothetical protein